MAMYEAAPNTMKPELQIVRIIAKALYRAENVTEPPANDLAKKAQQDHWQVVKRDYDARARQLINTIQRKGVRLSLAS